MSISLLLFYKRNTKIRLGSLELRIESGRFSRLRLEIKERLCLVWQDSNTAKGLESCIETDFHFIFICSFYQNLRTTWLASLVKQDNFFDLSEGQKLSLILNQPENVKSTAQFVISAYHLRGKVINK